MTGLNERSILLAAYPATKPIRAVGGFFSMSLDVLVQTFRPPFAWREYLLQGWFVARVSFLPALATIVPFTILVMFSLNEILIDIGAVDYTGAASSFLVVNSMAPISNVLVISGTGATAICADLGARVIRDELDAMRVMGINPIQALVVPRVLALTTVAFAMGAMVIVAGLLVMFFFDVFVQSVSPGAFVDHLTLLADTRNIVVSVLKTTIFGVAGGLIACYKGITVGGGSAGVGRAVNETVVYAFVVMFTIELTMDAITIPLLLK